MVAPSQVARTDSHNDPCRNGRKTAVTGGHPRTLQTTSDLGTHRSDPDRETNF